MDLRLTQLEQLVGDLRLRRASLQVSHVSGCLCQPFSKFGSFGGNYGGFFEVLFELD